MDEAVVERLLALNRDFYSQFAEPFVETRARPQEGFFTLLNYLPKSAGHLLDVGCGDGRFGRFALEYDLAAHYTGLDFSAEMLDAARRLTDEGEFFQRDLSRPDFLDGFGKFDLISCMATMQHIPGRSNRERLLAALAEHLGRDGRIILSNWQFLGSERQRRKIVSWREVGFSADEVEGNDYLMTWKRNGKGFRYVAFIDDVETSELAETAGLRCVTQFRSDGREGDLNLYSILAV